MKAYTISNEDARELERITSMLRANQEVIQITLERLQTERTAILQLNQNKMREVKNKYEIIEPLHKIVLDIYSNQIKVLA